MEKAIPYFREQDKESSKPGELLFQDTPDLGAFKGVGRVSLHTVVDTYRNYALVSFKPPRSLRRSWRGYTTRPCLIPESGNGVGCSDHELLKGVLRERTPSIRTLLAAQ